MNNIVSKNKCTGCTACMNSCPKKAINMKIDNNGFKYPEIDNNLCIDCGICKKICPILNTKENESLYKCFVGYNKNDKEIMKGSSGDIFSLIAKNVIEEKGIVIGAAFNDNNQLYHIAIESFKDIEKLQKSKYLQSDLNSIFQFVKEIIDNKKVLFVGTPCQIAGLKAYLNNNLSINQENLLCIDIICHGVPSPKLFEKYIHQLENDNNEKVVKYDFRDKSTGWDTYSNKAVLKSKTIITSKYNNKYMQLFLSDIALRESCYNCNFKLENKYSDITLGDFWGIKKIYPDMYNPKGVSSIIVNTEKGLNVINEIKNKMKYKRCQINEIVNNNRSLIVSASCPKKRSDFFEDLDKENFNNIFKKYRKIFIIRQINNKLKNLRNKVVLPKH